LAIKKKLEPLENSQLGQKLKMPNSCKKLFYNLIKVVVRKTRFRKGQILEKWDDFENQLNWP